MSTVDLANDEGFVHSLEEEDNDLNDNVNNGDRGDFSDGDNSSTSGDDDHCGSQPVDYAQLELAQRHRSRRPRATVGAWAAAASSTVAEAPLLTPSHVVGPTGVGIAVHESGLRRDSGIRRGRPAHRVDGGVDGGVDGRVHGRSGGAAGDPAWRRGSRGTVGRISVFTNPAPGGCRLQPLPQPGSEFRSPVQEDVGVRRQGRPPRSMRPRLLKNGNWTDDQLKRALEAVDEGQTMKKAAEENNIPYSSFRDHCLGKTRSRCRGVKGVLTLEEEDEIVQYLIRMCDLGFGITPSALKMKVFEITQHRWTPFRDGIPGDGWMRWFRRRHPELTLRASQGLESARARALCPENVQTLYDNL